MSKKLKDAKSNKVEINFGGRKKATFTAGGRKRYLIEKTDFMRDSMNAQGAIGIVMINGLIRFADGTEGYVVLEIDETSSGEHCGTGVFLPCGDLVWQNEEGFLAAIGKTKDEAYPYTYKPTGTIKTYDNHHIGSDGWSF